MNILFFLNIGENRKGCPKTAFIVLFVIQCIFALTPFYVDRNTESFVQQLL